MSVPQAQYTVPLAEGGVVVPQKVYATGGQADFQPLPPIVFDVQGRAGLSLVDAMQLANAGLPDPGVIPNLTGGRKGTRITLRILVGNMTKTINSARLLCVNSGQATKSG